MVANRPTMPRNPPAGGAHGHQHTRPEKVPSPPRKPRKSAAEVDFEERLRTLPLTLCAAYAPLFKEHPDLYLKVERIIRRPDAGIRTRSVAMSLLTLDAGPEAVNVIASQLRQLAEIRGPAGLAGLITKGEAEELAEVKKSEALA